jgi:hypothetical protein
MTPFQKAFNEAKREGRKTFPFNGKTYSTKTAEDQGREIGAKAAAGSGRGMAAGRTASDKDTTSGRAKAPAAAPAARAEIPKSDAKAPAASTERKMSDTERVLRTTAGALGGAGGAASKLVGMTPRVGQVTKGAASKAAPRVESRVGRPVTTKLDDAAAAFSRPQARQASKDTGYTREPSKTTPPQPTRAPKPRDEIIKRQAQMREGRKATEDYARDVMERGAEMGMKRGGNVKSYAKGGMTKGGGCETRGKKARYV